MNQVQYEVAFSGYANRTHLRDISSALTRVPEHVRVLGGFSTGFRSVLADRRLRRPNLFMPLDSCASLNGINNPGVFGYVAHFYPDMRPGFRFSLAEQVRTLYFGTGSWLSELQLNSQLIPFKDLREVVTLDPARSVVFPLGRTIMREIALQGAFNHRRLQELILAGVDVLLLDNGHGGNRSPIPLSYDELRACLEQLWQIPGIRLRVAGNLSNSDPPGLEIVEQLLRDYPTQPFGWEKESDLRNEYDRFDAGKTREYLDMSFNAIDRARLERRLR